jgi:hypothetical protein
MGKTAPSYRMALEFEIEQWKDFKNALKTEQDKEAFEELMAMRRRNAMAGGAACNPIIFEPMPMSSVSSSEEDYRTRAQAARSRLSSAGRTNVLKENGGLLSM